MTHEADTRETEREARRWALRGYQVRDDNGLGRHVATWQTCEADGRLLAAAPELYDLLVSACDTLDACERASATHGTADDIRARLVALRLR